ncbi:MAG: HEAT repeat domain-containing protein [Candidatus Hydrogenedentes bacterium]|nr:HEAT repeat domain-containing protein [Candidatus Hydrogenedentota bacterium]
MLFERFVLSAPVGMAVIAAFVGAALLTMGRGYRRLGAALAIVFGASVVFSIVGWFGGAAVGLAITSPGEGAGVAVMLFAFLVAGLCGAGALFGGIGWIVWKRERYLARGKRSRALVAFAIAMFAGGAALAGMQLVRVTPGLMSDRMLSGQASGPNGSLRAEAREELLSRGQEAVPEVIAALRSADKSDVHIFESGINGGILYHLEMLGLLGGPQAIAELRTWFISDYAPDIRAAAARGLGESGDSESAHAIAVLLEERSYEWRKSHFQLLRALALLKAKDELPHIKSALQFTPDEEGTSFQIGLLGEGIAALVEFDTPEAWEAVSEVANSGSGARRETVERILREMGKALPAGK